MKSKREVFTTGDVAAMCGVTLRTVINWIQRGKLIAHKLPGTRGDNRITREDLITFMNTNSIPLPTELTNNNRKDKNDSESILIVDDDILMAKAIFRILRRHEKQVLMAHNGFDAGLLYAENKPALMTLDLQMPKMDGFEVLESLKGKKTGKILVISAMQDHHLQKALDCGADAVLSKPFDDGELITIVEHLMSN